MFDYVVSFFIGDMPIETNMQYLWYAMRMVIGLILFDFILDMFRFIKRIFGL